MCSIDIVARLIVSKRQTIIVERTSQECIEVVCSHDAATDMLCFCPCLASIPKRRRRGVAAILPLADDIVVTGNTLDLQDAIDVALLHRPTSPCSELHCFLIETDASSCPRVAVLAELANIDGASVLRGHIGHVLHLLFGVVHAISMELQHHLRVHLG